MSVARWIGTRVAAGKLRECALTAVLVMASAVGAAAQPATPPSPDSAEGLAPQEVQRLFDAYAVVQAQEQLALSDEQYPRFVTRLKALQDLRRQHLVRRDRLVRELGRVIAPRAGASESEIKTRLDELDDADRSAASETRKAYEQIDEILDTRQRARFRVFEAMMERRKLDLLLRARQGRPLAPRRAVPPR